MHREILGQIDHSPLEMASEIVSFEIELMIDQENETPMTMETGDCPDYNVLLQLAEGRLSPDLEESIQSHLDQCNACFEVVVELARELTPHNDDSAESFEEEKTIDQSNNPSEVIRAQGFLKTKIVPRLGNEEINQRPSTEEMQTVFATGDVVGQFRIMRLIARGGMGQLYLARDLQLGRKVALKVIHPALFASERIVARFIYEAQMTARFNHPHIVTLYQVGSHEKILYVALEYLEGQDLKQRHAEEQLSLPEILRICLAVGSAVSEAHSHGILHRDLKPANILIPKDGRVRVVDFGLAHQVDFSEEDLDITIPSADVDSQSDQKVLLGTPAYMSPEQWRGESCTKATDVWALGLILYELCCDRLPYPRMAAKQLCHNVCSPEPVPPISDLTDVPNEIAELTRACLEKKPSQRPTAEHYVETIREVLFADTRSMENEEIPYRGLLPFAERHSNFFFGRETEITGLVERLRQEPILAVVGPSGAGKSSFVQAGIIPRLRENGRWLVLRIRPGEKPTERLAAKILAALAEETGSGLLSPSNDILSEVTVRDFQSGLQSGAHSYNAEDIQRFADALRAQPRQLSLELQTLAEQRRGNILLVVDQLEELVTLVRNDELEREFLDAICLAADDPSDPVRVILTIRDDFLGRISRLGGAVRQVLRHMLVLNTPNSETLKEILSKPLTSIGYCFDDPTLIDEMVESVDEPACLPLLQFTARSMWDQRDRVTRKLKRADYEAMGGVAGALAQHADSVLRGLSDEEIGLARKLLLRLVTPEKTRKTLPMARLLDGLSQEAELVVNRLTNSRLITVRKTTGQSDAEVLLELAHESLIHTWDMLSKWVEEGHDELAFINEISQAADLWVKRGKRESEVWDDVTASFGREKLSKMQVDLPRNVIDFLDSAKDKKQKQSKQRRLLLSVIIVTLVIIAGILGFQKEQAEKHRLRAEYEKEQALAQRSETLLEGAQSAFDNKKEYEARAKLRTALEQLKTPSVNTHQLWYSLKQSPHLWSTNLGNILYTVDYSPTGEFIAAAGLQGLIHVIEPETLETFTLSGHRDQVLALAFSPDGKQLATGGIGKDIRLWELSSRTTIATLPNSSQVNALAFHPKGHLLATANSNGAIHLWDTKTHKQIKRLAGHQGMLHSLSFGPSNLLASAGEDKIIRIWDTGLGKEVHSLKGHKGIIGAIDFHPNGKEIASIDSEKQLIIWDMNSGKAKSQLNVPLLRRFVLEYSPNGQHLAMSTSRNTVLIQQLRPWKPITELKQHDGEIRSVSFGPMGNRLASVGFDSHAQLWTLNNLAAPDSLPGHTAAVYTLQFSPDSKTIASGSLDKKHSLRIWDSNSGEVLSQLEDVSQHQMVAFSADGEMLASGGAGDGIHLWDLNTYSSLRQMRDKSVNGIEGLRFNRSGTTLAAAEAGKVRLWDTATGEPRKTARTREVTFSLHYLNQETELAAGTGSGLIEFWDATTLRKKRTLRGHNKPVINLWASPKGETIYSGGLDGKLLRWNPPSSRPDLIFEDSGRINWIHKHPTKNLLAIASSTGIATILNQDNFKKIILKGHRSEINSIEFAGRDSLVATGSDDGTVRLWNFDTGEPAWKTTAFLQTPAMVRTHRGWQKLTGGKDLPAVVKNRLDAHTSNAEQTTDGKLLCITTQLNGSEVWSASSYEILSKTKLRPTSVSQTLSNSCAIIDTSRATLIAGTNKEISIETPSPIRALAQSPKWIVAGTQSQLVIFDSNGVEQHSSPLRQPPSALLVIQDHATNSPLIAVGYTDGNIEFYNPVTKSFELNRSFSSTMGSPVVKLLQGPKNTTVAGYAHGQVILRNNEDGAILFETHVHGSPYFLATEEEKLFVSTELGHSITIDLQVFHQSRCELLNDIWSTISTTWKNGKVHSTPPPAVHPCFQDR